MIRPGDNPLGEAVVLVVDRNGEPREVRSFTEGYPGDARTVPAREEARRRYRVTLTLSRWQRREGCSWWEARVVGCLTSRRAP
jgi:hypothetical protein